MFELEKQYEEFQIPSFIHFAVTILKIFEKEGHEGLTGRNIYFRILLTFLARLSVAVILMVFPSRTRVTGDKQRSGGQGETKTNNHSNAVAMSCIHG